MFNSYPTEQRTNVVVNVQQKTPWRTDVIRLMKEYEEEVLKQIDQRFVLHGNTVSGAVYVMQDRISFSRLVRVVCQINGKPYSKEFTVPVRLSKREVIALFSETVGQWLAEEMYKGCLGDLETAVQELAK